MAIDQVIAHLEARRGEHIKAVGDLVRIPSVSADPAYAESIARCAEVLAGRLRSMGFSKVEICPTAGNPIVYGEWLQAPDKPAVLLYGHYDVQPAEPLEEWISPPWEATVRGENLYGRGAVDDKGQVVCHLQALEAYFAVDGKLPVNLKVLIEGEEEIGSPNLLPFVRANKDMLACDLLVISDTTMFAPGMPSLGYGLRGLTYCEITVTTADTDLHSGAFGGAVPNAANAVCEIVTKLKDADGRVTIPGFYDKVTPLTDDERQRYAALPFDEAGFASSIGISATPGETGYSVLERLWARPTLDVNGLLSGWTGPGAKTVIPRKAVAKVSMRLVPNQDPDEIAELFSKHVRSLAPAGAEVEVTIHHGGLPFLAPTGDPAFLAAEQALQKAFSAPVSRIREGGSIPFVPDVTRELGVPAILMGFGLPDENAHAPNENINLGNFFGGIRAAAYLYDEIGAIPLH